MDVADDALTLDHGTVSQDDRLVDGLDGKVEGAR